MNFSTNSNHQNTSTTSVIPYSPLVNIQQERLNEKIKKTDVCTRSGPGGMSLTYLESWKVIDTSNRIFGFNGWSCSIVDLSLDFCEQDAGQMWHVSYSCIVKITLRESGTSHEDIGTGTGDSRNKGTAIESAKKEAVSDARKRALRVFGDALGNCLYDKKHLRDMKRPEVTTKNESTGAGAGVGIGIQLLNNK
jgi:DNA repair and recombination protein RAD52